MFHWSMESSIESQADIQNIWKLWSDVSTWPVWDKAVEWCTLEGPFEMGERGSIKPRGWPVSKFQIMKLEKMKSFCVATKLPFTTMAFDHVVEEIGDNKVRVTHKATITGLMAPLLRITMGRHLTRDLLDAVTRCVHMAEKVR